MIDFGKKSDLEVPNVGLEPEPSADTWATSYGDLITLLLVFLVILVSSSDLNTFKIEKMTRAFKGQSAQPTQIEELLADLKMLLTERGLSDGVVILEDNNSIRLVIKDSLLFRTGEARIEPKAVEKILPVVAALRSLPESYRISIEGHTDDVPIYNGAHASNWHLSSGRALAVLDVFRENGISENILSARAYGDQKPMVPNLDERGHAIAENRRRNRRVVIRIR